MKNCWFVFVILILSLIGCNKPNDFVRQEKVNGYTVTHFDIPEQQQQQTSLKLSEMVQNARIVPLKTSKECLIGWGAKYYIGSSFILVFQENHIALFDSQGHFIRIIARQGKAPSEYIRIKDFCVDEKRELLYVLDGFSGYLKGYHLKDSTYFRQIETLEPINNAVEYLENGNFLLIPHPSKKAKYCYYQQTPAGELGEHLLRFREIEGFINKRLVYRVKEDYRYISTGEMFSDDTVYTLFPGELQPKWIFHCSASKNYKVLGESENFLFFTFGILLSSDEEKSEDGVRCVNLDYDSHDFYYDKRKGSLVTIRGIWDDYFSGRVWTWESNIAMQQGKVFYIAVSPMELFEAEKKNSEAGTIVKDPEGWKSVREKLTEDDNPILIIGNLS